MMERSDRPAAPARFASLVAAVALLIAACSAGSAAAPASTPPVNAAASPSAAVGTVQEVKVAQDPKAGAYLTGADGRALYVFKKDAAGTSACNGQCATNWPPLTLSAGETVKPGDGVTGTFATIKRDDGSTQVTYDGAPLYYFGGDKAAGDTNGQGLNGVWFLVSPAGGAAGQAAASSAPVAAGGYGRYGSGSGYGSGTPTPAPSASGSSGASATIVDYGFKPATLTVKAGTTVTWTNTGSAPHTVTADDGSFGSGTLRGGATFEHTFSKTGTYAYHCSIHSSMTATIVVTS